MNETVIDVRNLSRSFGDTQALVDVGLPIGLLIAWSILIKSHTPKARCTDCQCRERRSIWLGLPVGHRLGLHACRATRIDDAGRQLDLLVRLAGAVRRGVGDRVPTSASGLPSASHNKILGTAALARIAGFGLRAAGRRALGLGPEPASIASLRHGARQPAAR